MKKITIEDVINKRFADDDNYLKNGLDFVAHLRNLDFSLNEYDKEVKTYGFDVKYKGITLCHIHITQMNIRIFNHQDSKAPFSWICQYNGENDIERIEPVVDENIKETVWKNVRKCRKSCEGSCSPGTSVKVLGKKFDNVCACIIGFYKFTTDSDWECIKQIVTAKKNDFDNMQRTE